MKRPFILLLALVAPLAVCASSPDTISTYAGGGPNNVPATQANVAYPVNTSLDSAGNLYFVTSGGPSGGIPADRVYKVNTSGTLTVVAGNGFAGHAGIGGPATQAELNNPSAAAVDSSGNVYIADVDDCVIRKVTLSTGDLTTFAGTPHSCSYGGDGGPATSAELYDPTGVAVDGLGNVYIADEVNQRIRKVAASTGIISTVAGRGLEGFSGDGGPATSAELFNPWSVAVDGSGNVYISDTQNFRIRRVTAATGKISTIAGNGTSGFSGDGGPATSAEIRGVLGIAVDASGNVFIADAGNCVVREVSTAGIINTVAGTHASCGFSGDGGPATSAVLSEPYGVAVNTVSGVDQIYIADYNNQRIRKAALGGNINTVAGNGDLYYAPGVTATGASLNLPGNATPDSSGNVYIADTYNCIVRKVAAGTGDISTIAGMPPSNGLISCGYAGDGGSAVSARLNAPQKTVADSSGNVYISDAQNCIIRKVTASTGDIRTFAGTPQSCGYSGDGAAATSAQLYQPFGLALDSSGNLYIADSVNNVIRKVVAATGKITTVAGNYVKGGGYAGDGGPATSAQLYMPYDVALDSLGNLYIADFDNNRVRMVTPSGTITTYAGNGSAGYSGDRVKATETSLYYPSGVAVDAAGDVLIADYFNNRIRWIDRHHIIYTVAGDGAYGFSGDGGVARSAELGEPQGVSVDPSGNIYIADTNNYRVRQVAAISNLNASAYSLSFPAQPVGSTSHAQQITLTGVGPLAINSITTSGPFAETNDCPTNLPSGSSCNVDVTFTPLSAGSKTGTLVINTNGFLNPTITINLTGTGG